MDALLIAVADANYMWYALPLVIVVSLVYSATRHEQMTPILTHGVRVGLWIVAFMAVIFGVLLGMSWLI